MQGGGGWHALCYDKIEPFNKEAARARKIWNAHSGHDDTHVRCRYSAAISSLQVSRELIDKNSAPLHAWLGNCLTLTISLTNSSTNNSF